MAIERIKQIREETGKSLAEAKEQYLEERNTTVEEVGERLLTALQEVEERGGFKD